MSRLTDVLLQALDPAAEDQLKPAARVCQQPLNLI
jgi:hypothetical protein